MKQSSSWIPYAQTVPHQPQHIVSSQNGPAIMLLLSPNSVLSVSSLSLTHSSSLRGDNSQLPDQYNTHQPTYLHVSLCLPFIHPFFTMLVSPIWTPGNHAELLD